MYRQYFKRGVDILVSVLLLLILSPIMIIVMILLFTINFDNPFFIQKRPGKNNRCFTLFKFKTMSDKKGNNGLLLPDIDRLTVVGKFLRKTSLDELLQLLNVLKGDMSLIGPRPLLIDYLPLYNKTQIRRHEVQPGITGWAQVNGRNRQSWETRFELDVWYIDNISFLLDIKIIWMTFMNVIKFNGISDEGHATKEPFTGNINE